MMPNSTHTMPLFGSVNARLFRRFFERTIATIVEQNIALALHSPGAALHEDTLEPAKSFITAEAGEIIHVQVYITCNKEIDKAVAIIVCKGSAGAKASNSYPCFFRHVFEFAISQPFVERVSAKTGNVDV